MVDNQDCSYDKLNVVYLMRMFFGKSVIWLCLYNLWGMRSYVFSYKWQYTIHPDTIMPIINFCPSKNAYWTIKQKKRTGTLQRLTKSSLIAIKTNTND